MRHGRFHLTVDGDMLPWGDASFRSPVATVETTTGTVHVRNTSPQERGKKERVSVAAAALKSAPPPLATAALKSAPPPQPPPA
jgi:hypothetical protein